MNENEQALIRWVKGADNTLTSASKDPEVPIHPQLKAEFFARHWEKIWPRMRRCRLMPFYPFWIGFLPEASLALTSPSRGTSSSSKQKRPQAKQQGLTDGLPMPGACSLMGFSMHWPSCGTWFSGLVFYRCHGQQSAVFSFPKKSGFDQSVWQH